MCRMASVLAIPVTACAAQSQTATGPVTLGEQLDCALKLVYAAGYSPSGGDWDRGVGPVSCVTMEHPDGRLFRVCTSVQSDTVSVSARRVGEHPPVTTGDLALTERVASQCPPRPLHR